ncbi:sciellin isoform X2 [Lepisosteus oculatus]|uniref:sciellin isoform X2 n=1 Tax=Lepisosteus oculatus TaxID=7918 RepID=UPI0035F51993
MSYSYPKTTYTSKTDTKSTYSSTKTGDENRKKTSLLQDNSWIRRNPEEAEPVDKDENFGKSLLSRFKSEENLDRPTGTTNPTDTNTSKSNNQVPSVRALSKRFSGSENQLSSIKDTDSAFKRQSWTSNFDSPKTTTTVTKSTSSSVKTDDPKMTSLTSGSKITTVEETKTSITSKTTQDGKTTITTVEKQSPVSITSKATQDGKTTITTVEKQSPVSITSKATQDGKTTITTVEKQSPVSITSKATQDGKTTITTVEKQSPVRTSEVQNPNRFQDQTDHSSKEPKATKGIPPSLPSKPSPIDGTDPKQTISKITTSVSSIEKPPKTEVTNVTVTKESYKDGKVVPVTTNKTTRLTDKFSSLQKQNKGTYKSYSSAEDITLKKPSSYSFSRTSEPSYDYTDAVRLPRSYSGQLIDSSYDYTDAVRQPRSYSSQLSDSSYKTSSESSPTVYTKTSYVQSSRPEDFHDDMLSSKSIKTVYSTSDRSIIDRDMCTYCRKPINTEAKMILDDLQICCHASCFKCEVCNSSLGHLKAGDSMWIYRRTVHCESCFGMTREKWRR